MSTKSPGYLPPRNDAVHLTVDVVIFTLRAGVLQVLLIERGGEPYKGMWAIPGGFVHRDETLEIAARRELNEETGVSDVYLEQLYSFGDPGRDPRGRVITVAYYALVQHERLDPRAGSDAAQASWYSMDALPPLAFDHRRILDYALERLRGKLDYTTVGFQFLPEKFTLTDIQSVYEAILGIPLDKRNFRRRIDALGVVVPLKEWRRSTSRRPAQLFKFSARRLKHDQERKTRSHQ